MSNDQYLDLFNKFKEAKNKNKAFIIKNFFEDNQIPRWQEILDCIYDQYDKNKDVSIEYKAYITLIPDNILNIKYFLQLLKLQESLSLQLHGPKISIGPFYIGSHKDNFDGVTVHCEGNSTWIISDKHLTEDTPEYIEIFNVERGDLLFCPAGLYHSIKSSNARASILYVTNV